MPTVAFLSASIDLNLGINDVEIPGDEVYGFYQYLLSAYAFTTSATTTFLCGTVNSSGNFRILVDAKKAISNAVIRYYVLYIPM